MAFGKERYYMFFPQTADGLANLHDKIQLILVGSNLEIDEPNIKDNVIPKQFEELNDLNQISDLINKGIIRMQHRWNLNGKQLGMTVSDNFYIIFVRNID
ncbi:MAG: hypothetical protein Q7T12_03635 [Flavobacterium sp.]|nr:hypothetical protein [Flavobacterium sp.]